MANSHGEGTLALAFLAGAAIGIGVGMLIAPASGVETRKKIKDFARKAQEKAQDMGTRFATAAEEMTHSSDEAQPGH